MSETLMPIPGGSFFSVPGLSGAAVRTGVKPSGALDLAVVVADEPMAACALFTTNRAAAAPVLVSRERLNAEPVVRSFVVNSGNANALTGARGIENAEAMIKTLEQCAGGPGIVFSTGVIGQQLPVGQVLEGIPRAVEALAEDGGDLEQAILTTDTCKKTTAVRVALRSGQQVTIGGVAKGSGMIHPNMATMLAYIATDAVISAGELRAIAGRAVDRSFHEISVDGDTSTNDAVLCLARLPTDTEEELDSEDRKRVANAITYVARELAEQIVADGEGKTRVMEVRVEGAASGAEARRVATAVANSSLVKTALAGGDPNWGRIISAAGAAGVDVDPNSISLDLGEHRVFEAGLPTDYDSEAVGHSFSQERVVAVLGLGRGSASSRMLTTDLSQRYVQINSEYTT